MSSRFVLLLLALSACGAPRPAAFALSWRFADGRDCTNAGVANVVVLVEDMRERSECIAGFSPASTTLSVLPRDLSIRLEALSFDNNILYRGDATYEVTPTFATVTLYADQAR